jgi:hypothetical protein
MVERFEISCWQNYKIKTFKNLQLLPITNFLNPNYLNKNDLRLFITNFFVT